MLRPQDNATRETKNLDGLWSFVLDPAGVGRVDRWFAGPLPEAGEMAVPASYNDIGADPRVAQPRGSGLVPAVGVGAGRLA